MVKEAAAANEASVVFGPLGVGQHVDHLITRNAVVASGVDAVFYSDFPYSVRRSRMRASSGVHRCSPTSGSPAAPRTQS